MSIIPVYKALLTSGSKLFCNFKFGNLIRIPNQSLEKDHRLVEKIFCSMRNFLKMAENLGTDETLTLQSKYQSCSDELRGRQFVLMCTYNNGVIESFVMEGENKWQVEFMVLE